MLLLKVIIFIAIKRFPQLKVKKLLEVWNTVWSYIHTYRHTQYTHLCTQAHTIHTYTFYKYFKYELTQIHNTLTFLYDNVKIPPRSQ